MKVEKIVLTPEIAEQLRLQNKRNRPVKYKHLLFLCNELKSGRWKENGDAIRVAKDGTLIDGQHRVLMVIKTGIPITTLLVTDLENEVFSTIDTGSPRSHADTLNVAGEKNARVLAAALLFVDDMSTGNTEFRQQLRRSNTEALDLLAKYPGVRDSMPWASKIARLAPGSLAAGLHYFFHARNSEKADVFFSAVCTGADLHFDSPVFLLRKRLIENATAKAKLDRRYMAALFIKAWNAFVRGQSLKNLRFRETGEAAEPFPTIR